MRIKAKFNIDVCSAAQLLDFACKMYKGTQTGRVKICVLGVLEYVYGFCSAAARRNSVGLSALVVIVDDKVG